MQADQPAEHLDDAGAADRASDVDRQAFTRVLVNDSQALELLAVGTSVKDEVVGPDVVALERW